MAPVGKFEGDDDLDDFKHANNADTSAAEAALKARLSRKRTKTGCLTCRKRRIKCGEERPVCRNCIKSKRHCEGYNQRVVFKPPTFDFRPAPHGGAHITFQAGPVPGSTTPYQTGFVPSGPDYAVQSLLKPKPVEQFASSFSHDGQQYAHPLLQPQSQLHLQINVGPHPFAGALQPVQQQTFQPPTVAYQQPLPAATAPQHAFLVHEFAVPGYAEQRPPAPVGDTVPLPQTANVNGAAHGFHQAQQFMPPTEQWHDPGCGPRNVHEYVPPTSASGSSAAPTNHMTCTQEPPQPWRSVGYVPRPELTRPIDVQQQVGTSGLVFSQTQVTTAPPTQPSQHHALDLFDYECHVPPSASPTYILNQAAVEVYDDDYYDVLSDEEMDIDTTALISTDYERQRTLSSILDGNHITVQEMQTRRYDTFIYDGMLDHYRVEEHANPLRNPATARVFAHFISVTGPSLSIFERHPRNTSVLFKEGHVPFSQQGLWTYTMPLAAMHHQGLLHAMLALASLHIARLKGASVTPSMQHYAWALKRIHHCVGHTKKRSKLTTIAASMLLGFYEVMTADHMKWNTHLMGSKQLFVETDFVRMTQQFRRMKIERAARQHFSRHPSESPLGSPQDDVLDQIPDVDERMVSILVGREVRYGDHGHIMTPQNSVPPELDLSKFEILKDLYWWYCKQDVYQSIVSGNPLFMDFSRWANCPPRAPLGKPNAVYGSFDHLILLLGRIADFGSRDRARKLKQIGVNGGQWRPAPGMNIPRPPQQAPPPTPVSAHGSHPMQAYASFSSQPQAPPPPPQVPMFYGMAPPPRQNAEMPSSYAPLNHIPTPQSAATQDPIDLALATQAALKEYGEIRAALHKFAESLGDAFQPLTPEYQQSVDTPFGPALLYRTFDIGCLWAIYNMAAIISIRVHPHMPPAAHVAAGVAAQQTAHFANEIGRIAAGIVPGPSSQPLSPTLGAALCESCMPSFFAGVQYQDPHQRHATVARIFSIAQRTGWGSAELIASGCETSWVKAAAAGRGPPYTRIVRNEYSDDPRLNGSWERLDTNSMPDQLDERDRRLVGMAPTARLNWAIGIMGTEEDVAIG